VQSLIEFGGESTQIDILAVSGKSIGTDSTRILSEGKITVSGFVTGFYSYATLKQLGMHTMSRQETPKSN